MLAQTYNLREVLSRKNPARQITVQCRNNYGATVIYPICEDAKKFAAMLGQKTLTPSNIQHILSLGYEIHDQPLPPTTFKL